MEEISITEDMRRRAAERLNDMEEAAKPVFEEIFPNLDFEKDFLQNDNFEDIAFMFETVDRVPEERHDHGYIALYKLLEWTYEGLAHELHRQETFEIISDLSEEEKNAFIRWMLSNGFSDEEANDPEIQVEVFWGFQMDKCK